MVNINKRHSFSLAEVLVTLTIIGVVAGMTIPPLVQSYQNQEYVTRLKKAYTTTNQALQQMATDMGCTGDLACTGLFSTTSNNTTLGDAFVKYFNVIKNCKTVTNQGCWINETNEAYDGSSSTVLTYDSYSYYNFTTADGMSYSLRNFTNDCVSDGSGTSTNWSTGRTGQMQQVCGTCYIDVNGPKPPNNLGRDTFIFFITNAKGPLLYPFGATDDYYSSTDHWWLTPTDGKTPRRCNKASKTGHYCTGRIIEEGWQMNY